MKVYLFMCFLVVYVPQLESLKIIDKLKNLFKPVTTTTTTTTLVPPVVPEYEKGKEDEETQLWTVQTTTVDWNSEHLDEQANATDPSLYDRPGDKEQPPGNILNSGASPEVFITTHATSQRPTTSPSDFNEYYNQFQPTQRPAYGNTINPSRPDASVTTHTTVRRPTSPPFNEYYNQFQPTQLPPYGENINSPTLTSTRSTTVDYANINKIPATQRTTFETLENNINNQDILTDSNKQQMPEQPLEKSDDDAIVFPDHPFVNHTSESEKSKDTGYTTERKTSTSRTPRVDDPVDDEIGRRIINAPDKDCGGGNKADENGKCRKVARK